MVMSEIRQSRLSTAARLRRMNDITDQEFSAFERARTSRDARFDGLFYIAVRSTRIYCRPVCPAPAALARNVTYFRTASEAQVAGYRPCLRCRPEIAPGDSRHRLMEELTEQAWLAIQDGALDTQSPTAFAESFGVSERQLRRQFLTRWRTTPAAVASARRLHVAKQLLTETRLPVTEIALAAGFRSIRAFNEGMQAGLGMNPLNLRKQSAEVRGLKNKGAVSGDAIELRLPYRPPYDWDHIAAFLKMRALTPIESVEAGVYRRVLSLGDHFARIEVAHLPAKQCLVLRVRGLPTKLVPSLVQRVRRSFDLDADPKAIADALSADARLKPLLKRRPGLRLPVGLDALETGVRAILGQQISVAATTTLLSRLLVGTGEERAIEVPAALALRPANQFGIPLKRAEAVRGFAAAIAEGRLSMSPIQRLPTFVDAAVALPGIGPWTANYMAMRALGAPDAFVVDDLIIKRSLGIDKARELIERVAEWRPWRAYAVLHLWAESTEGDTA